MKVNLFPLVTTLYADTRLPLQYPGGGVDPAAGAMELSLLLVWIQANLPIGSSIGATVSSGGTLVIPAGKLLTHIAIVGQSGARTIKIGTGAGLDDIMELTAIPSGIDYTLAIGSYSSAAQTLYFTITGGTATIKAFVQM